MMLKIAFRSIQARLLAAFLLVILVLVGLTGLVVNRIFMDYFRSDEAGQMAERTRVVAVMVRNLSLFRDIEDLQAALPQVEQAAGVKVTLITEPEAIRAGILDVRSLQTGHEYRAVVPFVRHGIVRALVVIDPVAGFNPARRVIFGGLLRLVIAGLAISALLAYWLARSLSLPLRQLAQAATELGEGQLQHRLPDAGQDEIGALARNFNRMSDSLQASFQVIAAERDRLKEFIGEMSHELRTPLTALNTFNELLLEGADSDPAVRRDFLLNARQQIERMKQLTENLLQLSRLDAGVIQLQLEPADLRQVVGDSLVRLAATAGLKGVTLDAQMPPAAVPAACDASRLGQALDNLVSNGIKYAPAGGMVRLSLTAKGGRAQLRITDNGPGISPADVPKIFQRFYRGQNQPDEESGSGLGLAIVRSVVEAHGGEVAVTDPSTAEFTVSLPLYREEDEAAAEADPGQGSSPGR